MSNPTGPLHVEGLSAGDKARILLRATPKAANPNHAKGVRYLANIRQILQQADITDYEVEAVWQAVVGLAPSQTWR